MPETVVALIVAVARNGVIGRNGDLPWRLSSDLKLFRRLTMGKPIIMGRRTWDTLHRKPLDGRDNIVVTRDRSFRPAGATVVHSIKDAIAAGRKAAAAGGAEEIMVIGGAEIYRAALPCAGRLYWTEVDADPEGDTHFPATDRSAWREVRREDIPRGAKDEYEARLVVLDRMEPPAGGCRG